MRIAFLTVSSEMGGSERSLVELTGALRRVRPDWALTVVLPREGPIQSHLPGGVSTVIAAMPPALARFGESGLVGLASSGAAIVGAAGGAAGYARDLKRVLAGVDADVVHSNGFKHHVIAAGIAAPTRPLVWHIHEYVTARRLSRTLLRRCAGRVAAAVANSRSVACDLAAGVGAGLRIETIYNGIDLSSYSAVGATADLDKIAGVPPAPAGTVKVGLVATFGRWKGHDVFLRAIARLDRSLPVRAYIIGGAIYDTARSEFSLAELRAIADSAGVADRVVFTGFLDRIAPALRALDVVVHASTQPEPFGLAIVEAMACGRATIVSAAGGAAEIIEPGRDALTHVPGDERGLADAIARLAADPALRRRLGEAARASALARFDSTAFGRAFAEVYESVARPRAQRAR
jgi:glycosyltransferase involved in cell wall biosynthesis